MGRTVWAVTIRGAVVRTTDGGRHWSIVWSQEDSQPAALESDGPRPAELASGTPLLTVRSATSAAVVVALTRGRVAGQARFTNLVVYRTSDGGATWRPSVVRLPAG